MQDFEMLDSQNTSHAVMAQRFEPKNSLDDFPTPPWATRALLEHVLAGKEISNSTCWEPACGRGFMAEPLKEYFESVYASDIHDYGYGEVEDFTFSEKLRFDWIITNPPFKLGEEFALKGLERAKQGVALLTRTTFIESVGRFERLFSPYKPYAIAQFVERVPMVKGRLDQKASTATGYAWIIWRNDVEVEQTQMVWIPPCRKALERDSDYPK